MRRITTGTRELNLFGPGKDGFKNGDLANAILPTDLNADWFNQVQEELANFIEAAGIALDGGVRTQLVQALRSALLHGVDSGTANARVVNYTPAVPALVNGMALWFQSGSANTGPVTLNINGLGARPVLGLGQAALQGGEIVAGGKCQVVYASASNSFVLVASTGGALPVGAGTMSQHAMQLGQATGRILRQLVFTKAAGVQYVSINGAAPTTVGASLFTSLPGTSSIYVQGGAGGGGGGGTEATGSGEVAAGQGGTGGAYGEGIYTSGFSGGIPITVGDGGGGGAAGNNPGGAGGTTSVGSLMSCPPGVGGAGGPSNALAAVSSVDVGPSGAPTGANVLAVRGAGGGFIFLSATGQFIGSRGGASFWGPGSQMQNNGFGFDAFNPGSGGSGATQGPNAPARAGGAGAAGKVIITERA